MEISWRTALPAGSMRKSVPSSSPTIQMESSLAAGLDAMQAQLSLLNTTQDASEGVHAFLEKRKPEWTGR